MKTPDTSHYLDYWGFERSPFALTPDPDMLYLSKQHRECMLRLQYAIASNKGGALLVSENPGDGKTSVLRRLEQDLKRSTDEKYRIVFIDHPTLTPNQVFWEILRQLGFGESHGEKIQNLLHLREALVEMFDRGERCIFILDEGQLLADRPELLQEFRVLLNYTVGDTFLLTFLFSGQSELEVVMKNVPELYQRLPVRYFLHSMDLVDTGRMLDYRVKVAGYRGPPLFTDEAVREIYRHARGIPRVICTVADLALVVGHSRGSRIIGDREVFMAIRDLDRTTQDGYHYYHFLRAAGTATAEEEQEIAAAEQGLDRRAAEEALRLLEAAERGDDPGDAVFDLRADIEEWAKRPGSDEPEKESPPQRALTEPGMEHPPEPTLGEAKAEPEAGAADGTAGPPPVGTLGIDQPELTPARESIYRWEWEGGNVPEGNDVPEPDQAASPGSGSLEVEHFEFETDITPDGSDAYRPSEASAREGGDADETAGDWKFVEEDPIRAEWVHCPMCGTRQPAARTTCTQCSAPLHWVCPSCEHRNSAQHARCDRCGQSLAQAAGQAEAALKEAVSSSVGGPHWGFTSTPEFSLKLGEGERILAVVAHKPAFGKGMKLRARSRAWGAREHKVTVVVTNHRLHLARRDVQSRIPYHEIQGLRASRGKLLLFHTEGSLRMEYPTSENLVYILVHALIDYLEFQTGLFRV